MKIASYICLKQRSQTVIECASEDYQTKIFFMREDDEEEEERKTKLLLSLFAKSYCEEEGAFIFHTLTNRGHIATGIVINGEGLFSINAKELKESIPDKRTICKDFKLSEILF